MDENLTTTKDVLWIDGEDDVEGEHFKNQVLPFLLNDIEVNDDDSLAESSNESPGSPISVSHEIAQGNDVPWIFRRINVGNPIVWLSGPIVNTIKRFLRNNMQHRNNHLILEYFSCLKLFFGEDRVPPDIAAVFDSIGGTDKTDSNLRAGFDFVHQPQSHLTVKINQLSKVSLLDSHATKRLRDMLVVTLEMLQNIAEVSSKIQETMISDGCITKSTPEHFLCQNITLAMINLLIRLEVISSQLIKENLFRQEDIISAAKIMHGSWVYEIRDYILNDIFYSMASQIECFFIVTYESMVRLSSCICYCLELPDLSNIQHRKLTEITSDFAICVKDSRDSINSSMATCKTNIITYKKNNLDASTPKLLSFSRESKVKRHCDTIINCSEEFTQHINNIKVTASLLTLVNEGKDAEHYKKSVSELKRLQEISFDYSKQLQVLLNAHSVLINDLSQQNTLNNTVACNNLTNKPDKSNIPTDLQNEAVIQKDDCQLWNLAVRDCQICQTLWSMQWRTRMKYSLVFFAIIVKIPRNFRKMKITKKCLIPVKSKMKIREKEAVTKLFGNAKKDDVPLCDDDDDSSEANGNEEGTGESSEDEAVPVKTVKNKYNTHREEFKEDYNFPSHASTFAGGDFMKELKFLLTN